MIGTGYSAFASITASADSLTINFIDTNGDNKYAYTLTNHKTVDASKHKPTKSPVYKHKKNASSMFAGGYLIHVVYAIAGTLLVVVALYTARSKYRQNASTTAVSAGTTDRDDFEDSTHNSSVDEDYSSKNDSLNMVQAPTNTRNVLRNSIYGSRGRSSNVKAAFNIDQDEEAMLTSGAYSPSNMQHSYSVNPSPRRSPKHSLFASIAYHLTNSLNNNIADGETSVADGSSLVASSKHKHRRAKTTPF